MMSELKRVTTPVTNTMTVLEQGDEISRPCPTSSVSRKPFKKTTSEGLISLSPEPGTVKFEVEAQPRPGSGGSRCGSAGRIERKLQVVKKREEVQDKPEGTSGADGRILTTHQPDNLPSMKQDNSKPTTAPEKKPGTEKQLKSDPESSEESSETDSDDSSSEFDEKSTAPIELKGEFMKYVMDEDYAKAKELCQKILLIEPDNSVCIEFHGLIVQKLEQEKSEEDISDDDDDDDDSDEDSDEEDEDQEEDDDSSSDEESESDSDDDFIVPPGLNLIMGGLPINPQSK